MKPIVCTLIVCLAVGLAFTSDPLANADEPKPDSVNIECSLYYRGTANKAFDSKVFTIEVPVKRGAVPEIARTQTKVHKFDDMVVTLLYDVNMLKLQVTDAKTGEEIYGRLYQIMPGLQNQFVGGHGFTGLGYINHPTSGAQLQTFSAVKQDK